MRTEIRYPKLKLTLLLEPPGVRLNINPDGVLPA